MLIRYAHLASPQGESFQGFWVMDSSHQPMHARPFATKHDAQVFAAIATLESAISYISTTPHDDQAQQDALTILNNALETLFAERITQERINMTNRGVITYDSEQDDMTCSCGNRTHTDGFVAVDENGIECEPRYPEWSDRYMCVTCGATIPAPER